MAIAQSPLRYPGGKQILSPVIAHLIRMNGCEGGTYVEPYAGGAGVALALLFGEHVQRVVINDADRRIYAFWRAVLDEPAAFVEMVQKTPATVKEWEKQRSIYHHPHRHSGLKLGFATFFLNRCNRSGIIASGGPIGGRDQSGPWKIDARLNRDALSLRIEKIADYRERISLSNIDAIALLNGEVAALSKNKKKPFVYLDPPYYAKGRDLYLNFYAHDAHAGLAKRMASQKRYPWVMSYDNVPEIRRLYSRFRQVSFALDYSARERREGSEVMIFHESTSFPSKWLRTIPRKFISSADDAPMMPAA